MKNSKKIDWFSGEGNPINLSDMLSEIDEYVNCGGKVFIGTDSQLKSDQCVFVTAICLHRNTGKKYAKYYFNRSRLDSSDYKVLRVRIMREVQESLQIALDMLERYPEADIEVHVDVGRTQRSETRKFADSISGWLKCAGIPCKMKPYSWASSSVADWHTK
ncbi:ribonuclease H-like YkuK family protein [bacterium]|nr:ribonuclease H-like YkuK family protein [bacterium]